MAHEETIITYTDDGRDFEIDHLGITYPDTQWGNFAVYTGEEMVAEFCIEESMYPPEHRRLPADAELVRHAKCAVAGDYGTDEELAEVMRVQQMIGQHLPGQN